MTYLEYKTLCETVIKGPQFEAPYTNDLYLHYAKLNVSRLNRWGKSVVLHAELSEEIIQLKTPQHWIVIVEPWCGDAAPAVPFLAKLASLNPLVTLDIQLRDQEPFLINQYLTNGSKSIPKLIVRDEAGNDLFTWGPRPVLAQALVDELKLANADLETMAAQLQNWYNKDKGFQFQKELLELFDAIIVSKINPL